MRSVLALSAALLAASFLFSAFTYPYLPELVASHWDVTGRVDGYLPKFWGAFLVPFIMVGLYLLLMVIPRIDPLKANIMQFIGYYYGFIFVMMMFMLAVHLQVIFWSLGFAISPNVVVPLGIGAMFIYLGVLLGKAKRNWFIGIRTPWTLSSDLVWDKTHRVASRLFIAAGALSFAGLLSPDHAYLFVLLPVFLVALYTIIYSYAIYQRYAK